MPGPSIPWHDIHWIRTIKDKRLGEVMIPLLDILDDFRGLYQQMELSRAIIDIIKSVGNNLSAWIRETHSHIQDFHFGSERRFRIKKKFLHLKLHNSKAM